MKTLYQDKDNLEKFNVLSLTDYFISGGLRTKNILESNVISDKIKDFSGIFTDLSEIKEITTNIKEIYSTSNHIIKITPIIAENHAMMLINFKTSNRNKYYFFNTGMGIDNMHTFYPSTVGVINPFLYLETIDKIILPQKSIKEIYETLTALGFRPDYTLNYRVEQQLVGNCGFRAIISPIIVALKLIHKKNNTFIDNYIKLFRCFINDSFIGALSINNNYELLILDFLKNKYEEELNLILIPKIMDTLQTLTKTLTMKLINTIENKIQTFQGISKLQIGGSAPLPVNPIVPFEKNINLYDILKTNDIFAKKQDISSIEFINKINSNIYTQLGKFDLSLTLNDKFFLKSDNYLPFFGYFNNFKCENLEELEKYESTITGIYKKYVFPYVLDISDNLTNFEFLSTNP